MSYTALYRKFRPNSFQDVKGQEHIVTTLKNQIRSDRIGHAYLFCGTRGTGKTTVAKIFAKAVNCLDPKDGDPCGKCAMCQAIRTGNSMNVIEMDAASNNGVDNIRDIIDQVSYSPTEGRFKVYIIDEVHMLSSGAFNALLKTLEEPPEYVIFILATTEVHKIPVTVLSRCQEYDFHRITRQTLVERMKELMVHEEALVEDDALNYIAKAADGSMRDALSLLDQCLAFHMGETLTLDKTLNVLGAVDTGVFNQMFLCIEQKEVGKVMSLLEDLIMQGREIGQFVIDYTWYLRNLLLIKSSDQLEDVLNMSEENIEELRQIGKDVGTGKLMRYIRILSDLSNQLRFSAQKRILAEIAFIKMCKPQMEMDFDSLLDRVRDLEEKLDGQILVAANQPQPATEKRAEKKRPPLPKALPDEVKQIAQQWSKIKDEFRIGTVSVIRKARLNLTETGRLQVVFEKEMDRLMFENSDGKEQLSGVIEEMFSKSVDLDYISNDTGGPYEDSFIDLEKIIHMDIDFEEE